MEWFQFCNNRIQYQIKRFHKKLDNYTFVYSNIEKLGIGNLLLSSASVYVFACLTNSIPILDSTLESGLTFSEVFETRHWLKHDLYTHFAYDYAKKHHKHKLPLGEFDFNTNALLCSDFNLSHGVWDAGRYDGGGPKLFLLYI